MYFSPRIVTSGLVSLFDVLDKNSNPNNASWIDLVNPARLCYLKSTAFGGGGGNGKYIRTDGTGAGLNLVGSRININTTASNIDRFNISSNFSFVILAYPEGSGRIFSTGSAGSGTTDNCIWQMWLAQSIFYWWNAAGGGTNNIQLGGTHFNINTWNHITITYSSSGPTARVYLNGVQTGVQTGATDLVDRTGQTDLQWALGGGYAASCTTLNQASRFQQFSIYNRTLSATEVLQNFNAVRSRVSL